MYKHILVPTDGSAVSQAAARSAVNLARESGARIVAFYAMPEVKIPHYYEGVPAESGITEKFARLAENEAKEIVGFVEALCREAGVACSSMIRPEQPPYEAIIAAADACGCDLIFMASHGRRGLSGILIGSETHKVLTHAKIPVLVYR